jgi:hypothetical protein
VHGLGALGNNEQVHGGDLGRMDLGEWLRSLGLEQYEGAFRDNAIDSSDLPKLTAEDLKDLGVSVVGHRRKLLDAPRPHPRSATGFGTVVMPGADEACRKFDRPRFLSLLTA